MPDIVESIVSTLRQPVLVLDTSLSVVVANPAFCALFGLSPEETLGSPLTDLADGQWSIPGLLPQLEQVRERHSEIRDFRAEHEFRDIGRRVMLISARYLESDPGAGRVLLAIDDITQHERQHFELEAEKEFAAKIVDASREALLILDWDLRVRSANETFYETFHVDPDETQGRLVYALGDGQWDIPRLRELLEDVLPDNDSFNDFEVEHDFPRIGRKSMLLNARRLDHTQLILLAIEDTTERRRSAEVTRLSEERLSAILEHVPIGVGLMDREGNWLHLNPEMRRFMGSRLPSRDPEAGHRWQGFGEEGAPLDPSQYPGARALRGEASPPPVDFLTDITGEPRWVRFRAVPLPRGDGDRVQEVVAVLQDITGEKRVMEALRASEQRLRESEARLAAALRAGRLGVHDYDPQSKHARWDSLVRSLWGIPDGEEVTYDAFMAGVHPEDVPSVERALGTALDPEGPGFYEAEYRVIHRETGEVRWVRADGEVTFEGETPVRLIGTVADISDQKQAEQERDLLMHELSHRVKNTLGVVQSLAMQMGEQTQSVEEYQQVFVGRLHALARAQSLLVDAAWQSTDLSDLVAQATEAFRVDHPELIQLVGESVTVNAKQALGLSLVLHELGTNAAKYGALSRHEGCLRIAWRIEQADADSARRVRLEWQERHGPVVKPPEAKGFGTQLIEGACAYELDGEARLDYASEGLTCEITFPLE